MMNRIPNILVSSTSEETYEIKTAMQTDAEAIRNCYKQIHITTKESLELFPKCGGMFRIPSKRVISDECALARGHFVTANRQDGKVAAIMRLRNKLYDYKQWEHKNDLSYVELVVNTKGLAVPFLLAVFQSLLSRGYDGLFFQIYHLLFLEDKNGFDILNLDNMPSKKLHSKIGARQIGSLSDKKLVFGGGFLHIRPNVYYLGLDEAVSCLKTLCKDYNWRLSE